MKQVFFSNLHFAGESQSMTMPMLASVVLGENTTFENVNKLKKLVKITLLRQQMLKEQVSTLPLHSSEQVGDMPTGNFEARS